MATVEIRDHSIWIKHIHGDTALKDKLLAMPAGTLLELSVDGFRGMWCKMADSKHGLRTDGIKAIGPAQKHWHALQTERGRLVEILST